MVRDSHREFLQNLLQMNNVLDILNYIFSGVAIVDLEGRIIWCNKSVEKITGYRRKEMLGKAYTEYLGKGVQEERSLLFTLRTITPIRNREKKIVTAKGAKIPVRFSTSILTAENGEVVGAIEIFEDLSPIKKLKEEIRQLKSLAVSREMTTGVAHAIRNPLGAIGGYAALLERDLQIDDPRRRLVKKIMEGVANIDKILKNLAIFTPSPSKVRTPKGCE